MTDLAYQAQLQKSKPLLRQQAEIQSALAEIRQAEANRAIELKMADQLDPATRARADVYWSKWLERQKKMLIQKQTEIALKLEEERQAAAYAFGRKSVAEELLKIKRPGERYR